MNIANKFFIIFATLILIGIFCYVIDQTIKVKNKSKMKKEEKVLKDDLEGRSGLKNFMNHYSFKNDEIEYNFTDFESHENYHFFENEKCGPISFVKRIEGGEKASLLEFPWMVALFAKNKSKELFFCGGSLINERLVLTATHCCVHSNIKGYEM